MRNGREHAHTGGLGGIRVGKGELEEMRKRRARKTGREHLEMEDGSRVGRRVDPEKIGVPHTQVVLVHGNACHRRQRVLPNLLEIVQQTRLRGPHPAAKNWSGVFRRGGKSQKRVEFSRRVFGACWSTLLLVQQFRGANQSLVSAWQFSFFFLFPRFSAQRDRRPARVAAAFRAPSLSRARPSCHRAHPSSLQVKPVACRTGSWSFSPTPTTMVRP